MRAPRGEPRARNQHAANRADSLFVPLLMQRVAQLQHASAPCFHGFGLALSKYKPNNGDPNGNPTEGSPQVCSTESAANVYVRGEQRLASVA